MLNKLFKKVLVEKLLKVNKKLEKKSKQIILINYIKKQYIFF